METTGVKEYNKGVNIKRLVGGAATMSKPKRLCSVEGCDKFCHGKGFCAFHYQRLRDGVSLDKPLQSKLKVCSVEGCDSEYRVKGGLCNTHYKRYMKYGSPHTRFAVRGENRAVNPMNKIYHSMKKRCYDKHSKNYKNYGGRGIKVCERWLGIDGFANFLADMGERPSTEYSIDRENVNGDYEPSNCRWATRNVQSINRRTSKNNKSGVTGVYYLVNQKVWVAKCSVNGSAMRRHFKSKDDAIAKRREFEEIYYKPLLEAAKE